MGKLRARLTYANVMATVAVFIALGGASYAAVNLPPNSVGTPQLKNRAVTPPKLAAATIQRFRGETGLPGPTGPIGPPGPTGGPGPTGPSDAYIDAQDGILELSSFESRTKVAELALPAGSYIFFGKLYADNEDATLQRVDCEIADPAGALIDYTKLWLSPTSTEDTDNTDLGTIALTAALTLNTPGTVTMRCGFGAGTAVPHISVASRRLVAIKVGALHP
jgi:hypothetical protein